MRSIYLAVVFTISSTIIAFAQSATIHGTITSTSGKAIPFATIIIKELQKGQTSDEHGKFKMDLPPGQWNLDVSAVGFQPSIHTISIHHNQNLELNLKLHRDDLLETVEVFGNRTSRPDKIEALTRLPLEIYDQIQSISVISDKLIKDQGALTISEVVHNVPGVYTFATYGNKRESMSSRGFRGIPILKNGVRVHSDFRGVGILTDMQGIDNVQVLKGAAAITQGVATDLGSPGGVINLVTKTPKLYRGGTVGLRVGSYGQARTTFDVYSPVNKEENLAFRINGALEMADSYRNKVHSNRMYVNPSLLWLIDEKTKFIAEMDYFNDSRTPDLGTINMAENDVNAIYHLPHNKFLGFKNDRSITKNTTYSLRLDRELSDKLELKVAFYNSDLILNDKGASLGSVIKENDNPIYNKRNRGYSIATREDKNSVLQLDLIGDEIQTGRITHTFQIGFDFRTSKFSTFNQKQSRVDVIDVFDDVSNNLPSLNLQDGVIDAAESRAIGFIAQDVISFTDWFKTFLGVRLSKSETILAEENNTSSAINPLGGIIISPTKNINIFGSYTNSSYPRTAARLGEDGKELGTERFDQLEAGIKSHWLNGRFRANLTFFKINNTDMNLPVYDENWIETGYYQKGGNDQRQGVELEFTGRLLENLELIAGYSYIDAQYKEHTSFVYGSAPLNTPKHTFNFYANYGFKNALEGLHIGAGVYYTGKRPINDWSSGAITHEGIVPHQKPFNVDAYTEVNAQIGYHLNEHWNLRFIANNIFDKVGYNAYRTRYINQTTPRSFAVSVDYNF